MALPLRAVKPCNVPQLIIRSKKSFSFAENSFRCQNRRQISTMESRVRFQGNQSVPSKKPGSGSENSSQAWRRSASNTDLSHPVPLAKEIFFQGLKRVIPSRLITTEIQLQGSLLRLEDNDKTTIDLSQYNKKYVIGMPKKLIHSHKCFAMLSLEYFTFTYTKVSVRHAFQWLRACWNC